MSLRYKPYASYAFSNVEWLKRVPDSWKIMKFKQACAMSATYGANEAAVGYVDEGVRFLRTTDINEIGELESEGQVFLPPNQVKDYILQNGDFLISRSGTLGRAFVYDASKHGLCSYAGYLVRFRLNSENLPRFMFYFTKSLNFLYWLSINTIQSTIGNVNGQKYANLTLGFPPLPEQQAIVVFLDRETARIDALIARKERLLELLEEKRKTIISQAVCRGLDASAPMKDSGVEWLGQVPEGWAVMSMKRLGQVKRGASPRPIDDPIYFDDEGEYGWVRISDVTTNGRYLDHTEQRLSKTGQEKSVCLDPGRIFISIAGSVGKVCITRIKCCIHDGFVYFENFKQNSNYFYYILTSPLPYQGLGKLGTQLNLNTDTIGGINVPVPSLTDQQAITTYLDAQTAKLDALRQKMKQSVEKLSEYRASLISAAVTGKIDVRGEVPS